MAAQKRAEAAFCQLKAGEEGVMAAPFGKTEAVYE
jgi:hypothetical protein